MTSPASASLLSTPEPTPAPNTGGLSTGTMTGIGAGLAVVAAILSLAIYYSVMECYARRRNRAKNESAQADVELANRVAGIGPGGDVQAPQPTPVRMTATADRLSVVGIGK